jgi:hypothetical protein
MAGASLYPRLKILALETLVLFAPSGENGESLPSDKHMMLKVLPLKTIDTLR